MRRSSHFPALLRHYGEQISKAKENLDGLKVGAFEAAMVCSSYHPGKVRAMGVPDLPFLPKKTDIHLMPGHPGGIF